MKNRTGDQVTVDDFYAVIRESYAYARRHKAPQVKKAAEVLDMLRKTCPEAEEFARERPAEATPTGAHGLLDDTMAPRHLRCPRSFSTRRYATAASSRCSRTISGY
ncbi:hypothetical protein ACIQRK_37470 [Streptomyces anulatus]